MNAIEEGVRQSLARMGFLEAGERPSLEPLAGGVSSEIWKVSTRRGVFCVKQARRRLKVAAHWEAPLDRNHAEAEWLRVVGARHPGATPTLLAEDPDVRLIVMEYLPPEQFRLWKTALRDGEISTDFAAEVGAILAAIHAATGDDAAVARRFATDRNFHALRLEPYLEATARAHPEVADRLFALSRNTAAVRRCLVHGDISPKNILIGPEGPIFLDAECAWFGDPAFDLAFVLNHLMLKCLWRPAGTDRFLAAFDHLREAYFRLIAWADAAALEARVAVLLPGLFLARVDGKSPVEYVEAEHDKDRVRRVAKRFLREPASRISLIRQAWREELAG